ncbi:MAG: glycine cleavage system protein GcvH [Acidobacteriota bacterium]|nr:glycine cleavage system protein GcvH [Blastocatellia bacterium]MDW8411865.1 glycine cleavage system protein GcvH [Acidobacteriota bacterium]
MSYPENLLYTKDHEWIKVDGERGTIGITDFAQSELGDIVYVELPKEGDTFAVHETFGSVESVKTVSEMFMPVSGTILEVNQALTENPELVNTDPYGAGWMIVVKIENPSELDSLMSASEYEDLINEGKER